MHARLLAAAFVATAILSGPAYATPREIVIANEALRAGGASLPKNLDAFLRRLEQVAGWKKGSLGGKAFPRPAEALDYLRAGHGTFAILPIHQFVQSATELKFRVVGRTVGLDGPEPAYWGVARGGDHPYDHLENFPGLRLAATEIGDLQWINVLFEANVDPRRHFTYVAAATSEAALDLVLGRKADVALIYEDDFNRFRPRIGEGRDLMWVYTSAPLPPPPVVAVGKRAAAADVKAMTRALSLLCKQEGATSCARMAILYAQPGYDETYVPIVQKYAQYRMGP